MCESGEFLKIDLSIRQWRRPYRWDRHTHSCEWIRIIVGIKECSNKFDFWFYFSMIVLPNINNLGIIYEYNVWTDTNKAILLKNNQKLAVQLVAYINGEQTYISRPLFQLAFHCSHSSIAQISFNWKCSSDYESRSVTLWKLTEITAHVTTKRMTTVLMLLITLPALSCHRSLVLP